LSVVKVNALSSLLGKSWAVLSVYLFFPIYLKYMGPEGFGLIGFYSTFAAVLVFADFGFTATLNREFAKFKALGSNLSMMDYLKTIELVYVFILVILALVGCYFADNIAVSWLKYELLTQREVFDSVRLMVVAILLQMLSGMYIGGLLGLQKQVKANSIQVMWGMFRGGGAVLLMMFVSAEIEVFFAWQVIVNLIYLLVSREVLNNEICTKAHMPKATFNFSLIKKSSRYMSGMAGMTVLSMVLLQADKLVVSRLFSLVDFGYYTLAGTLALIPITIATPIVVAIFPRFVGMWETNNYSELKTLYQRVYQIVSALVIPLGLVVAAYSESILFVWTGDRSIAAESSVIATFLILGQVLQAITLVPFYLALSTGEVSLNLKVSVCSILILFPLLIWLVNVYGVLGAALSWFFMNMIIVTPYMYILHKNIFGGGVITWFMKGLVFPLVATIAVIFLSYELITINDNRLELLVFIISISILSIVASLVGVKELRALACRISGLRG